MKLAKPRFVRDIMTTEVGVLHEEENLELAQRGMQKYRFRHLPVVDGDKLVGLVTERDLLRASVSTLDENHALRDDNLKRYFFVSEIMTVGVTTVGPDTKLTDALRMMTDRKLGCLPVTAADGTLLGIVTQTDFLALAMSYLAEGEAQVLAGQQRTAPPHV